MKIHKKIMSAENKDDVPVGNDDLARTCEIKVKVEVGESEDEDWVPLVDPLSPSSDFIPTTRRYETRKRHANTVLFEGSDSNSDKGSDWAPEEGESKKAKKTPQKNIKKVKIIKVDDGLSNDDGVTKPLESSASQSPPEKKVQRNRKRSKMTPEECRERHRVNQRLRRQKLKSVNSAGAEKGDQEQKEVDDGGLVVTEALEETSSQPGKEVQRKLGRSKPLTPEERRERHRENQRRRRQKLKSPKPVEVTGEAELDVRCSVSQPSEQTYLERYEARNAKSRAKKREWLERMTPEERAEHNRKMRMAIARKRAAMTAEQREEQRQKQYLARVIRKTKRSEEEIQERRQKRYLARVIRETERSEEEIQEQRQKRYLARLILETQKSAEELEAVKEKQRARSRAYRRKMLEERGEEFLAKANQYMKNYWKRLTPEERRRRTAKCKANARRTPEQRERMRQQTRLYWGKFELRQKLGAEGVPPEQIAEKVREFVANFPANQRKPSERKPSERKRKRRTFYGRGAPVNLQLEPELLARIDPTEQVRVEQRFNAARTYLRKKLIVAGVPPEEMEEKFKELKASYEKFGRLDGDDFRPPPKLKPNETPEQMEARLMKARVAVAKFKLRKRLTAKGEPPEVIEEKLRELVARHEAKAQVPITFRPHKPRAKQKRWIRNESEVATSQDNPQAAVPLSEWPTTDDAQASLSPSPSSPNSYCEPNQNHPDSNPASPQIYESPEMLPDQPQMHPELKMAYSMASVQITVGNNDRASSPPASTFQQPMDLRHPETFLPPPPEPMSSSTPPPEADMSDDGFEQDEHDYQEKFVPLPPSKKTRRRSPSSRGGAVKRRRGPRDGPRGSYKAKEGPVVTCELCRNAYSPGYIATHKKLVHNPNWVDGKCVACGMEFSVGQKFLVHYNTAHVYTGLPEDGKVRSQQRFGRRPRKVMTAEEEEHWRLILCKLCGKSFSRSAIAQHKRVEHHPNYQEGKCTLCNTEFRKAVDFYEHFKSEHRERMIRPWERKKNFVCAQCGDGFSSAQYLSTHEYSVHGEGSKEENFPQCPFCVQKFRSQQSLNEHLRNVHPEEESSLESRSEYKCRRCGDKCRTNKVLLQHVSAQHPDSYFPCPHCERLMYTEQNLNDHFLLCKVKRSGGEEEDGLFSEYLATVPLPCEFCAKEMRLCSLKKHYRIVHGVVEEPWTCSLCSHTSTRRHTWLNHLDGKHGMPLGDELKEEARKMNVVDRSQVEIKNLKGLRKKRVCKNGRKRKSRKTRSPKKSMDSCSEDDEDEERKSEDEEETDKTSEDEGDAQENEAIEVVSLRRSTRSRPRPPVVKPEIPKVEKERRLVISVVRMSEKEIKKWSDKIVCEV